MLGNAYYAACQWLVLIVLARFGSVEDVGIFTLALALTAPVVVFFGLGLRTILASDVRHERRFSAYVTVKTVTATSAFLACSVIALWYTGPTRWTILAVAAAKTVETVSDLFYGYAQREQRLDRIALSLALRGTIGTALLTVLYLTTHNLALSSCAYAAGWLGVLWCYDRKNVHETRRPFDKHPWAAASPVFRIGLPLGLTGLMGLLGPNIPRYVLENSYGAAALGVFSGMAYFMVAGNIPVMALGQSLVPILARLHANGEKQKFTALVLRALGGVFLLGMLGVAAAYFFGAFVLDGIYGPAFAAHADILPLIAIAAAIVYLGNILGFAISSARIFVAQAPAFTLVALASLAGALLFIPAYGLKGAAYTLILNAVAFFLAPLLLLVFHREKRNKTTGENTMPQTPSFAEDGLSP